MGVLDPEKHRQILKDVPGVCHRAGIPEQFLRTSAASYCTATEIEWLVHFRKSGWPGLRMAGPRAMDRCMAITGALVRNFIDARVRTVDQLIDDPVESTVLVCPNFYTGGKGMPAWRVQKLHDIVCDRYRAGLPTVIWAETVEGLREYGAPFYDLVSGFGISKA